MKYEMEKFNPLDRMEAWDEETQSTVKKRLSSETGESAQSFIFLNSRLGYTLERIINELIYQPLGHENIKIAETIDRSLNHGKSGVRIGSNPWRGEFYRQGLDQFAQELERELGEVYAKETFAQFIKSIFERHKTDFLGRFLRQVLSEAAEIYYSHPAAWQEIGYPGPAYPEGYYHLECDKTEKWEARYKDKNKKSIWNRS